MELGASTSAAVELPPPRPSTPPAAAGRQAAEPPAMAAGQAASRRGWWPPGAPPALALHIAAGIFVTIGHSILLARTYSGANATTALNVASLLIKLAWTLFAVLRPGPYWRHRAWMTPAARISIHALPPVRSLGIGTSILLHREPTPGLRGFLTDAARTLYGTRQLGPAVGGLALTAAPAATLLTQSALLLLTGSDYCSTLLLSHPMFQQRTARFATLLEYATLPVLLLQPLLGTQVSKTALALRRGEAPPDLVCRTVHQFHRIAMVVVLPTLWSVYCWSPPPPSPRRRQRAQPGRSGAAGALRGVLRGAEAAFTAASRALHFCLRSPAGDSRGLVAWWILAIVWWLSKRAHGLN